MFTGIVEELGVVTAIEPRADAARITIECGEVLADVSHGASIAVSGVCLTVTAFTDGVGRPAGGAFTADVMAETLKRSSLGGLVVGDRVNLERPVRLADRLGGHLVQGHVDGVGVVLARTHTENWDIVRIGLPPGLDRYVVEKGSVTVDGVSLTVVEVNSASATGSGAGPEGSSSEPAGFTVSLIPTTLADTTLGTVAVDDKVNIEVDVLAKYVEKLHAGTVQLNGSHR